MVESVFQATQDRSVPRRDYGALIVHADTTTQKIQLTATWISEQFDTYYAESRDIPYRAKEAFEKEDPRRSLALSKRRLSMYSESIAELASALQKVFPSLAENEELWGHIETQYLRLIERRYEADIAFAYVHSVRRKIYQGEWKPVEYSFTRHDGRKFTTGSELYASFAGGARVSEQTVMAILNIPKFSQPYRALREDALRVAERVNRNLGLDGQKADGIQRIEVITAGFYRNRGAYIVGRIVLSDDAVVPLIIALLNEDRGIYVDAVLNSQADAHNLFSSTLANFHVTHRYYHELSAFLHSIMPQRPLGLIYSTIGFNHVGKVAVLNELKAELTNREELFETAVGFPGTVTVGFAALSSSYSLKVIRDKPTAQYKWGKFGGLEEVLEKYKRVHEINRAGSMLDNIIYYNLKLERKWFEPSLLGELLREAKGSVFSHGDSIIFKHLIVQRKIVPLPVFLQTASQKEREHAVINLGYSIKNNMAANILNKDLDARNYGVSRYLRIFLFDYDALEPLTEAKIRTNQDRIDGEEDIPEWYFEEGVVFLPEEIKIGLGISDRKLLDLFSEVHGDLLTMEYWQRIQDELRAGKVPRLHVYPEACKLKRSEPRRTTDT